MAPLACVNGLVGRTAVAQWPGISTKSTMTSGVPGSLPSEDRSDVENPPVVDHFPNGKP